MKFLFPILFFSLCELHAQIVTDFFKQSQAISQMECLAHQRLNGTGINGNGNTTSASNNFDVKYYRCEWDVDPALRFIKGKVTVYFIFTSLSNFITLDLSGPLIVDSVVQRNVPILKQQSNNTLTINFANNINTGTLDSVSIFYAGVPSNSGLGSFTQSTHNGIPVLWSLSEPFGSRDWWPCKNGLDDKADSIDIIITNPAGYRAVSNGMLQSETPISGGTKIVSHWKHRYPIASYLICFAVTNYSVFNTSIQLGSVSLPMLTYCYPESLTAFQNGTVNTLNALQLYNDKFGEYPFSREKYGHVQFGLNGGMEHQTNSFVYSADEGLCTHELAHQWFGDKITCSSWKDIWLNEGFATHLASIYNENKYPLTVTNTRKTEISNITSLPDGSVAVDDTTDVGRIFDSRLTYTKGSHLLYMLRWILGDSVFFQGIKNYQTDPAVAYGFASSNDLKRNLEQTSGRNLSYFFNEWYSGQGYPSYNVEWTYIGSGDVRIKMNQTTSHTSVPFFELPVALQFKNATQQTTVIVDNTTNGEIFYKNIGFIPDTVLVDPDYWLITKNNTGARSPDIILSVDLQKFTTNNKECAAYIGFTTSLEVDIASFDIEYSNDGISYSKLANVKALGNNIPIKNYSYQYQMQPGKDYYFRIKMIHNDGAYSYGWANKLSSCDNDLLNTTITPNPARNFVTIKYLPAGKNNIHVFAQNGQLLKMVIASHDIAEIDLHDYPAGTYLIQIENSNGRIISRKIIKQ